MLRFVFVLFMLVICSCSSAPLNREDRVEDKTLYLSNNPSHGYSVRVVEIEGCEYLVIGTGYSLSVTHKGNCKHCLERKGK